jgi:GT2 family glycosyltransferase
MRCVNSAETSFYAVTEQPRTRRAEQFAIETRLRCPGEVAVTEPDKRHHVDCAIIIVTYNSARDIAGLLDSLPAAAAGLTLRVIVVDNGSVDATVQRVRDYPEVVCVQTGANLGYSGGINIGREHAGQCGALAVLNPDLILESGALREMFTALDDPGVGVAVPMLLDYKGRRDPSLRREPTLANEIGDALFGQHFRRRPGWTSGVVRDEREYDCRHAIDWATGAVMLISAACDRVVGAWDERFFLYMEEVDYAARVRAAGLRVEYVPQARARHRGAGSGRSPALLALMAVNRVRYFEKHGRPARALRAVVLLNQFLRLADPGHRAALWAVSRRSAWEPLISGLKASPAGPDAASPTIKIS